MRAMRGVRGVRGVRVSMGLVLSSPKERERARRGVRRAPGLPEPEYGADLGRALETRGPSPERDKGSEKEVRSFIATLVPAPTKGACAYRRAEKCLNRKGSADAAHGVPVRGVNGSPDIDGRTPCSAGDTVRSRRGIRVLAAPRGIREVRAEPTLTADVGLGYFPEPSRRVAQW